MQTWQSWQTTKTLVWTDGGCQTLTNALHLVWRWRCGVIAWNGGFRTCPVRRSNDGSIPSCRERYCQQVGRRKLSLDPTWRRSCKEWVGKSSCLWIANSHPFCSSPALLWLLSLRFVRICAFQVTEITCTGCSILFSFDEILIMVSSSTSLSWSTCRRRSLTSYLAESTTMKRQMRSRYSIVPGARLLQYYLRLDDLKITFPILHQSYWYMMNFIFWALLHFADIRTNVWL